MAARDYVLEDFYVFCEEALKMPLSEQPHREIAEFVSSPYTVNKLLLVPRGCWKTSLTSIAYPLWMVLRANFLFGNPTYRVLIDSATVRLSKMVIGTIKSYVKNLPTLENLFGKLYAKEGDTAEGLSLAFRVNTATGIKEPNFLPSGVGAEKTGLHFELIVMDDLVTKENIHTVNGREKVWDHYRMMEGIIESSRKNAEDGAQKQDTVVTLVGTRYHDDDVYGRIIKQDKKAIEEGGEAIFQTMIRQAVDPDTGALYFPDRLDHATLELKKKKMGSLFWAQYMNDPNQESAPFKKEWLRWKSWSEFPQDLHRIRLTVDPAFKEDEADHGDYCAMVVAGWDRFHQLWVLDVSMDDTMTVGKFIDEFMRLLTKWNVDMAVVEAQHQEATRILLQRELVTRGINIPIRWEKVPRTYGKLTRWMELQPYAERGGIRIAKEIPGALQVEIQDQWERAPFATHDDFMDALSLHTLNLPLEVQEGAGRDILTPAGELVVGKSVDEILADAKEKRMESGGFYSRTLADRFPHIRALQLAEGEEDLPPSRDEENFNAMRQSFGDV